MDNFSAENIDVVLATGPMPDHTLDEILRRVRAASPHAALVLHGRTDLASASDSQPCWCVSEPAPEEELRTAVYQALKHG
jgi:hypothetical protein